MHLCDYALHVYVCIGHCIIAFENNNYGNLHIYGNSVVLANIVMQQNGGIPLSSLNELKHRLFIVPIFNAINVKMACS